MDATECRVLIESYQSAEAQLAKLITFRDRFEAFRGFVHQAQCERVQVSREKPFEKSIKLLLILKRPTRPVLVVRVPRHGPMPEQCDTLFWTEPKEFSDEGVLLAIRKPIGSLLQLKRTFKNADGARCPTRFFSDPTDSILSVRSRIQYFEKKIEEQRDKYVAAREALELGKHVRAEDPSAPQASPISL